MNQLIQQDFDKFSNKTTTTTIGVTYLFEPYIFEFNFRHESTPDSDSILLDIIILKLGINHNIYNLSQIVIRLNNMKNYSFRPRYVGNMNYSFRPHYVGNMKNDSFRPYYVRHDDRDEYYYCDIISPELLKEIADATEVEIKLFAEKRSNVIKDKDDSRGGLSIRMIAKALYDTIYNSNEYKSSINEYIDTRNESLKKAAQEEEQRQQRQQQRQQQQQEEIERKIQKRRMISSIISIVLCIVSYLAINWLSGLFYKPEDEDPGITLAIIIVLSSPAWLLALISIVITISHWNYR